MSDDRIRQLLSEAVTRPDDRERARERIHRRVRFRRRRRAAGASLLVAAGVVGTAVVASQVTGITVPVIGQDPPGAPHRVATACGEVEVDADTADYLRRWTEGRVEDFDGPCVLAAREGPQPRFDISGLGPEQPWQDDPAPAAALIDQQDTSEMSPRGAAKTYPYVFLGTNPLLDHDNEFDRSSKFLWWHVGDRLPGDPPGLVFWCQGSGFSRMTCDPYTEGILGVGGYEYGETAGGDINALVAAETAAAQLLVDGEPVGWQRPRGRAVWFALDDNPALTLTTYTIVAYDTDGRVLAEYEW